MVRFIDSFIFNDGFFFTGIKFNDDDNDDNETHGNYNSSLKLLWMGQQQKRINKNTLACPFGHGFEQTDSGIDVCLFNTFISV